VIDVPGRSTLKLQHRHRAPRNRLQRRLALCLRQQPRQRHPERHRHPGNAPGQDHQGWPAPAVGQLFGAVPGRVRGRWRGGQRAGVRRPQPSAAPHGQGRAGPGADALQQRWPLRHRAQYPGEPGAGHRRQYRQADPPHPGGGRTVPADLHQGLCLRAWPGFAEGHHDQPGQPGRGACADRAGLRGRPRSAAPGR
jgi:hypothetical protein